MIVLDFINPFFVDSQRFHPADRGLQIIFRSDRVLHRVLPCNAERFMLTVWVDSPDVNSPEESTLRVTNSQLEDW